MIESSRYASSLSYCIDRLAASDPGLVRLRTSAQAVLAAGFATALLTLLARSMHQNPMLALIGIVVPMMSSIAVQDPTPAQQKATMMLVPLVASAAVLLGSSVARNVWLGSALFLLTIFAALEAKRYGPRGAALGTIAYLSYFFSMFMAVPFAKAPWLVMFIFAGCAIAFAVRFWLVPERPEAMLRSQLNAFRARISALLYELSQEIADGGRKTMRHRIRSSLSGLNDISLQIESQLERCAKGSGAPKNKGEGEGGISSAENDLRSRVLECEIAAEALSVDIRAANDERNGGQQGEAERLSLLLQSLREAVRNGAPFDLAAFEETAVGARLPLSAEQYWRLCRAAKTLTAEPAWRARPAGMSDDPVEAKPVRNTGSTSADEHGGQQESGARRGKQRGLHANTRQALKATVAASGAMLAGHAISNSRWYWAVIAAFVVFTRAVTLGQALSRAWQRVLGTVAGVGLGLGLAELTYGSELLELGLLFTFIAAAFYLFRASYSAFVLLLTTMLAMLYELTGRYSAGLLYVRLEETLAGAAIAVVSAAVVLPLRTSTDADRKSAALLREAAGLLRSVFEEANRTAPQDAVRDLDRSLQALRQLLLSVTGGNFPAPKAARRRLLHRLSVLVYCIRHLYTLAAAHPPGAGSRRAFQGAADMLARNMETLAAVLEAENGERPAAADWEEVRLPFEYPRGRKEREACAADTGLISADLLWQSNEVVRAMYADAVS